jgi:predicted phosphatase
MEEITLMAKTVAVDFDGTISEYEHGFVHPPVEPPTRGAQAALRALATKGYEIVVFSVRANQPDGVQSIWDWLKRYDMAKYVADVTSDKPKAIAYIDDRGVHFNGSWASALMQIDALEAKEKAKGQTV